MAKISEKFDPQGKIPPYAIAPKSELAIGWDGAPLLCRVNGKIGTCTIGTRDAGSAIYMHLLEYRWISEARWGGETEYWLDILFLDVDRQVCLLPLRSNAATRFGAWLKGLQSNPKHDYIANAVWARIEMLPTTVAVFEVESTIYLPEIVDSGWVGGDLFSAASRWLERFDPDINANCWIIPGSIEPAQ
jgi:hypothetical protein